MILIKFQIFGDSLTGYGLSFDVRTLGVLETAKLDALVDMANAVYKQGRESALLSFDDRFDLHGAVEVLRALAVVVGPITGDRHRRAADIIARLLQEQEA
jgi:hypothetical protein